MKNILYVEDNDYIRDSIVMLLENEDRAIQDCNSAESAQALLQQQAFDVLITDINLPGKSGVDLARAALSLHPQTKVLLCSGDDYSKALPQINGQPIYHLRKPFEPEELDALIRQLLVI